MSQPQQQSIVSPPTATTVVADSCMNIVRVVDRSSTHVPARPTPFPPEKGTPVKKICMFLSPPTKGQSLTFQVSEKNVQIKCGKLETITLLDCTMSELVGRINKEGVAKAQLFNVDFAAMPCKWLCRGGPWPVLDTSGIKMDIPEKPLPFVPPGMQLSGVWDDESESYLPCLLPVKSTTNAKENNQSTPAAGK